MKRSLAELQTIILFNESDRKACVYTHNEQLLRRLKAMHREHPEQVYVEKREHSGAVRYAVPKEWVTVLAVI